MHVDLLGLAVAICEKLLDQNAGSNGSAFLKL